MTELVAKVIGYTGRIEWDPTKPNGTPRKLLDVSKAAALGWTYRTELEDGIRLAYEDLDRKWSLSVSESSQQDRCTGGKG